MAAGLMSVGWRLWLHEFLVFGFKQAYACLFAGYLLFCIVLTHYWYPLDHLYRYDFLLIAAVLFQIMLLALGFETWRECVVIVVFHVVAMVMEIFKTSDAIGSWMYPEPSVFQIGHVPLFAGFMYSAVGSYIARIWRIFEFRYQSYPNQIQVLLLVFFIYLNFFTHHFIVDGRWLLLGVTFFLFRKTWIYFKVSNVYYRMPLLLGWLLVALFIWLAENMATYTQIWLYPSQIKQWDWVPLGKLSSWYLLMLLSFALVSCVHKPRSHG